MSAVTFDTLKFAKRLEQAGIPITHAEAMAEAFHDATGQELLTKTYLDTKLASLGSTLVVRLCGFDSHPPVTFFLCVAYFRPPSNRESAPLAVVRF